MFTQNIENLAGKSSRGGQNAENHASAHLFAFDQFSK
jgi:hypothetical protein